ncbi:MAG: sigma-54-dependent Fis family transcriptional regulator [Pyrinomonadaceae bacterium]|nr:sigma-54-dependent Fis family transcriptional regulator [Pyrinomonadaceae bacterium]
MKNILIVDDEPGYCSVLKVVFEQEGYAVSTASGGNEAMEYVTNNNCDLIISDVRMPDMDGIGLLKAVREFSPDIRIVLMTAFGTLETAREAFILGADDFIQKPFQNEELKMIVERTLEKQSIINENRAFRRVQRKSGSVKNIVGKSATMTELFKMIRMVSEESSTVLITGESGTGKELVARAIHDQSARADKPFIPINCGAMPEHLLEAELFGFVKGTFTGANANRTGLFESATGGTILLDEIGDMPMPMQVKILRVLQDNLIRRVGATNEIPVDVRVIAATNCDIDQMIEDGTFRRDLYYRLSVMPVHIPALRERSDDIPELVKHFTEKFSARSGKKVSVSDDAQQILQNRTWDGNVRELEHVIERAVALNPDGGEIQPEQCQDSAASSRSSMFVMPKEGLHLPTEVNNREKEIVVQAFENTNGNQTKAAALLQIPVHAFRHLLTKHGISTNPHSKDAKSANST